MTHSPETVDSDTFVLSISGLRIAARSTGSGDPVLLLNGMSRPMESWAFFAGALRDRTVIAFDGSRGRRERNSGRSVLDADVVGCRCTGPRCSRHRESGCRRVLPRRRSRPAVRGRPSHPREPTRAACDCLWGRRGSRPPPRCHPNLADAKSRNTVAAPGSVGLALADRCHLDLVQHPRSRLHRCTHPRGLRRPRQGRPAGEQSATCGAHPRRPPRHDPGRTRSAKARPGGNCGPTGGAVSRFGNAAIGGVHRPVANFSRRQAPYWPRPWPAWQPTREPRPTRQLVPPGRRAR